MADFPPQDLAMRTENEKGSGDPTGDGDPQDLSMRTENEKEEKYTWHGPIPQPLF